MAKGNRNQRGPRAGQAGASLSEEIYNSRTDETLTLSAKLFRDAFVKQYIIDFSASKALYRMGAGSRMAQASMGTKGAQLLREPYVANKIKELVCTLLPTDIVTRGQVMAHMWNLANNAWGDGDKVAATAHVAKMLGMFETADKSNNDKTPVGVMLIPVMGINEWQQSAATAQALLKRQAMETPPPPPAMPAPQPAHGAN